MTNYEVGNQQSEYVINLLLEKIRKMFNFMNVDKKSFVVSIS